MSSKKQGLDWLRSRLPSAETAERFARVTTLLFIWVLLFAVGVTIDSEPYRQAVSPRGAAAIEGMENPETVPALSDTLASLIARLENTALGRQDSLSVVRRGGTLQIVEGSAGGRLGSSFSASGERSSVDGSSPNGAADQHPSDIWAFFMVLICFTPTNLALLTCTAGALGAIGRSLKLVNTADRPPSDETYPLLSAVIRGLFVYLIVISGLLALLENPILNTASPGQYIRYAGLISLTSFVVNYDPSVFALLLDQVRERMEEGSEASPGGGDEEGEASSRASPSQ